jgi:hypothetical protein
MMYSEGSIFLQIKYLVWICQMSEFILFDLSSKPYSLKRFPVPNNSGNDGSYPLIFLLSLSLEVVLSFTTAVSCSRLNLKILSLRWYKNNAWLWLGLNGGEIGTEITEKITSTAESKLLLRKQFAFILSSKSVTFGHRIFPI